MWIIHGKHGFNTLCVGILFLMLSVPIFPGIGWGQGPGAVWMRTVVLKIDAKTEGTIVVGERHFKVIESTVISNIGGKKIPLVDLPIPCEAKLQYRLSMDKEPEVVKVSVQKLLPHSTPDWLYRVRER